MAFDPANSLGFYLSLAEEHKEYLAGIRHWNNLKISVEEGQVWVKELSAAQADSLEVKSIPHKRLYYSKDGKLFPLGSHLPDRNIPSVLWSPIDRGLPVTLPSFNHNYFGIEEKLTIRIIPSGKETEPFAQLIELNVLKDYMQSAPTIRLKDHDWVLMDDLAFITGVPLLPLPGTVFWKQKEFLLPAGYDLELHALADILNDEINPEGDCWILWNKEGRYIKLQKALMESLTIASFRETVNT